MAGIKRKSFRDDSSLGAADEAASAAAQGTNYGVNARRPSVSLPGYANCTCVFLVYFLLFFMFTIRLDNEGGIYHFNKRNNRWMTQLPFQSYSEKKFFIFIESQV